LPDLWFCWCDRSDEWIPTETERADSAELTLRERSQEKDLRLAVKLQELGIKPD
jgi:hypothetical protein